MTRGELIGLGIGALFVAILLVRAWAEKRRKRRAIQRRLGAPGMRVGGTLYARRCCPPAEVIHLRSWRDDPYDVV